VTILALVIAVATAVAGGVFAKVHGVATDRGLHLRAGESGEPLVVPWGDIVSLESTLPWVAEYRMELRHDAPALEVLTRQSNLLGRWKTRPNVRTIGSSAVWDLRGWRLEAIQDAIDRHVLQSVGGAGHDDAKSDLTEETNDHDEEALP